MGNPTSKINAYYSGSFEHINYKRKFLTRFFLSQRIAGHNELETSINFNLIRRVHVKLCIEGVNGVNAYCLIDECLDQGFHSINFDTKKLPAGIYVYKIEIKGFIESRKVMIIK